MFRLTKLSLCVATIGATVLWASSANAVEPEKKVLGFRMKDYSTVHMNDPAAAAKHIETLKALKCEVSSQQHDGHTDVKCRTVVWKLLALDSEEKVTAWTTWLKGAGFETLYSRPVSATPASPAAEGEHLEIIQYRAPSWLTLHIHEPRQASEALAIYQALGCKTEKSNHAGHTDLRVSCPDWREFSMPDHQAAGGWENYLKKAGFETKHEHRH